MRVLVVEDQPRSAQYIRRRLEDEGQTVAVAGDAGAAIDWLFQNPPPDLVVLDLMLARGDGFAVLETLRRCSGAPILVLSARDTVADKVKALDLGADDYLVKPFDVGEFLARVRRSRGARPPSTVAEKVLIRLSRIPHPHSLRSLRRSWAAREREVHAQQGEGVVIMTASKLGSRIGTGIILSGLACWALALALWLVPA